MLKIFLKFGKLSCSFFHICSSSWWEGPGMSLAFMIKAHSSQDCRRIRILSIKLWNVLQISQRMDHCDWLIRNLQIIRDQSAGAAMHAQFQWDLIMIGFWCQHAVSGVSLGGRYKHVPIILTVRYFFLCILLKVDIIRRCLVQFGI